MSVIPELKTMSTLTERAGEWAIERMRVGSGPERIAKEDLVRKGMKVKSESKVAQSCPTLSNPMDYSLPGSSVYGIFQVSDIS